MTKKNREQAGKTTVLFIDEIEDDSATLLFDQRSFTIPRALLPEDSHEGEWLTLSVARTAPPPDDTAAQRERMGSDDPGGTIKL